MVKLIIFILLHYSSAAVLSVIEVCRHGARAPGKLYPFDQNYWEEVELEELTGGGMRQHYLIGAELRQRYVINQQLLSATFNRSEVVVVSTDSNRTLSSAYSQLVGLFPPGTGPQVTTQPVPPIFVYNLSAIESALGLAALPAHWQVFPISSMPTSMDSLLKGYSSSVCPYIAQLASDVINGDVYQSMQSNWNMTLFRQASEALGVPIKTIKQAASVSSALECDAAAGYSPPEKLTDNMFQQLQTVHGYYRYSVPFQKLEARKLAFSAFFQRIIDTFDEALQGKGPKFSLYSTHDTMLSGLLATMEFPQDKVPPFASTIFFELFENATVGVTYNDEPVPILLCSTQPCSYDDFKSFLLANSFPDYQDRCQLISR